MANIQHPEGLEEGLRQSAAGEVVDLGSFAQYAIDELEDRSPGDVFTLSKEDRAMVPNGDHYELFTIEVVSGEKFPVAIRPDIVADYSELDYGYLIQKVEGGFRFIGIEAGENDYFGTPVATQKAAVQAALKDWKSHNGEDLGWAWTKQLAKDAVAPDASEVDAKKIEEFLIGSAAGVALTEAEIKSLAQGLAAHLSSGE